MNQMGNIDIIKLNFGKYKHFQGVLSAMMGEFSA